ncbi:MULTISPECIES: GAF and ANTAR domain-containing protein [Actinomadura]|uniref:GAF and ANTAR domain-containing protein n=1 Tax=Actinomadura yumaensis TaxID=111807 RepID=A0ABW2CJ27_9ACTN|nr:GAF and ANTAR domain-containing protein [Actinomadura sp. J1-007]
MESHRAELPGIRAFVELADTLVSDFDVMDFLHGLAERAVDLLDVQASGLLVTDQRGNLALMAASSEQSRLLELFQLQNEQGPCLDCFRSGEAVHCADLTGPEARRLWGRFAEEAVGCGFSAVSALPMRLRHEVIGALNLFSTEPGELAPVTVELGQALADIATIGLLHERAVRAGEVLAEQLQTALTSRIIIEQAKGVLAERHVWSMERAFTALRDYARSHNGRLTDIAHGIVTRTLDPGDLIDPPDHADR